MFILIKHMAIDASSRETNNNMKTFPGPIKNVHLDFFSFSLLNHSCDAATS